LILNHLFQMYARSGRIDSVSASANRERRQRTQSPLQRKPSFDRFDVRCPPALFRLFCAVPRWKTTSDYEAIPLRGIYYSCYAVCYEWQLNLYRKSGEGEALISGDRSLGVTGDTSNPSRNSSIILRCFSDNDPAVHPRI